MMRDISNVLTKIPCIWINAPSFPVQASKFWGGSDGSSEESTDYSSDDSTSTSSSSSSSYSSSSDSDHGPSKYAFVISCGVSNATFLELEPGQTLGSCDSPHRVCLSCADTCKMTVQIAQRMKGVSYAVQRYVVELNE